MTTLYIDKKRLENLVRERDESEKGWWCAHPSSQDQPPEAYALGHQWAATEAKWRDLQDTFVALFAVKNIKLQPGSFANESLRPFSSSAAKRGLLDATKSYQALSDQELLSLRLFIEGAHSVALLVVQNSKWTAVGIN